VLAAAREIVDEQVFAAGKGVAGLPQLQAEGVGIEDVQARLRFQGADLVQELAASSADRSRPDNRLPATSGALRVFSWPLLDQATEKRDGSHKGGHSQGTRGHNAHKSGWWSDWPARPGHVRFSSGASFLACRTTN
jgi:hypothetical protein